MGPAPGRSAPGDGLPKLSGLGFRASIGFWV